MKKLVTGLILGLCCWAAATVSHATNYALCTGLNKYKTSYVDSSSFLNGCVPDAKNVYTNITLRGEWQSANATLFTNDQGTFAAVSNKLMSLASTAVSGDVVLYYHSSHGYQDSGRNTGICMYDKDMPDSSFAKILANFKAGVKVVVVLDTCHSAGMFKSIRRDGTTRALDTASPFTFAQRVNEELAAIRADEAARGIRTAPKLAVLDCGWITAADYNQYSWDGDVGGAFTDCFVGSVKSGACDKSPYGNGDSYATFMEMFDYAVAQDETHGNGPVGSEDYTMPQCTNTTILKAVTFGWVGNEEPTGIRFAPIPEQTATVGAPLSCTLVASNVDGSTGTIEYSIASSTAPSGSYALNGADFTFTAPADGSYSFDFLATNKTAKTFGKASMTVAASLAAPAGLDNTGITATSFTANWDAVPGAASYLLDVASEEFGSPKAAEDAILSEDFSAFTGTAADRSDNLDEYLTGTGWEGSKVFENAGSAKLGSSKATGWISTPALDLSAGGTVSFLLTQYGSDANTVLVSIVSGDDETEIGSVTPGAAETVEFTIPAATSATSVKIATSTKRAIIDDLVVTSGGGADVLANQPVEGTSYTVEGLETATYYWRVRAVGNAKGPFSATEEVTLKSDPSAPPSIRKIDDIEIEVGETATAQVKVSAPDEAPVTSLSITDGDAAATLEDGVFSFAPATPGTYDFTITAVNANGPAEVSFAVVATLADPETPEQPAVIDSDSFTAAWEPVPGADSYELVVIEGKGGSSGGGSGGSGDFALVTSASGLTAGEYVILGEGADKAMGNTCSGTSSGYLAATDVEVDGSSVSTDDSSIIWTLAGDASSCTLFNSEAGMYANPSTAKATVGWSDTASGAWTLSMNDGVVTAANGKDTSWILQYNSGAPRFACYSSSQKKLRFFRRDGAKFIAKVVGDVVFSNNVGNVTSFDVSGLQPLTEYTFAFRAIAGDEATEWSEPVSVKTADGPAPAAWAEIPAQSAAVGYPFSIDLAAYASGVPTPSIALVSGDATLSGAVLSFTPPAVGDYSFTVTASNASGPDAETTFTVSAVDHVPAKYAVCVGINEYADISGLSGCVNDSIYMEQNLVERGGWAAENVVRLNDAKATKAAIRKAIADVAAKAQAGDTFVYQHSSHGGQFNDTTGDIITDETGKAVYLCVYDELYDDNTTAYNDYEIAADLAAFNAGVKVAVIVDACHSGGLFKSKEAARAAARSFDLAGRVTAIMEADRAARKARGENVAKSLAPSEIGWATAAEYYETSLDGGFFHTDEWLTNNIYGDEYWVGSDDDGYYNYPSSYKQGGVFTASSTWGWWHGDADTDAEAGDNDGFCDVYEFWKKGYDFCSVIGEFWWDDASANFFPQCTNVAVLKSIELGYAGTPTLDAPVAAEAADVTASSFTASWSAVDDATGYRIQVATDPSFSTGAATDTLTVDDLAATETSYTEFSGVAKDSGAVYAGKSAKSSAGAIQLNTGKDAGIWTTASGGNATRVAVEWNGATTTSKPRSLKIYGSDAALDSASAVGAATHLGTIVYGTDTALDITGTFPYVGILPEGGALYIDSVSVDWGVAGSGSSIVVDDNVGNVTSCDVSGLEPETDYWYRVQALGDPVDSDFSNVIALTTEASAPYAPVWSEIPLQTAIVGEALVVELKGYVTGSPKPTITADVGTVENSILTVSFAEPGDYTVTLTAENSEGSDTATLAVSVTTGPVTVPTLTLSNPTSECFDASWDACTGVSSYTLQIATDDQFSAGSAGGEVELFVNPASSVTAPEGWTYAIANSSGNYLQLTSTENSVVSPAVSTKGLTSLTISFEMRTYNGTSGDSGTALVEYSTDGSTWAELGTAVATSKIMSGRTVDASAAIGLDSVQFRWTAPNAVSSKGIGIQSLALTGTGSAGDGSLVKELTVEGTSTTVTGLDPETLYYARVKGEADWSEVKSITTEADVPSAPVWGEIPPQTVAAGQELVIDLTAYVSGSPKPTITADAGTVENGVLTVSFADADDYTINLTAENSEGSVSATLAVTVTDAPVTVPVLTLSNPTDTTFDAEWTACTGATSYQFQVATAPEFKAARAGDAILSEAFAKCTTANGSDISSKLDEYTETAGWTGVKVFEDDGRVKLGSSSAAGSLVTPAVDIPAGAAFSFKITKYGTDTGTVDVQISVGGGEFESLFESPIAPVADGETYETEFDEAVASAQIKFVTSAKRAYVDDVVISGEGGGGSGSAIVIDETTSDLSCTVEGLEPDTTYYARVRMAEGEWSAVESITTTGEGPAGPAKYAVCVGLSEYDMAAFAEMGLEVTPLKGCVNDATYLKKNLTERGGWADGNVSLLTNGSATKSAIRGAIAAAAAKAKAGDTFVYEHSSHGLQGDEEDDYTVALATYDSLYEDAELAEDLASFADGVKVVVLVDACHSGGLFDDGADAGPDGKARSAASFDIAARVSALIDANRAARKARGEDVSRTLAADQIGWVTAASYEETSKDAGYYDTDAWMDDDEADGEERGGAFLAALAWGWWSGKADVSGEGDGDGWFDAYEGWSFSTPVCAEYDQTPQYLNEDVLRAVELGWVGDAAPSDAIVFDPVPGAEVAIGEEATLAVVAKNADGTTDGITLSIVATDPEDLDYAFTDGTLAFTPAEDGIFLFTVQAVKGRLSATKILGVTAVLPAPVAQEATDIAEDGFTANWLGVDAARNYQIQVSTDPDFPMGEPEMLVEEGFDEVTDKASLPEGWEFTGTFGTYATGGEAAPSIKLSTDKAVLTTPSFELNGGENGLAFWTKGNGTGTNMTSTLTVEQLVGEEWLPLEGGTFVPSTAGETKQIEGLDADATRIRFVMAKIAGNIAIDDVVVAQAKGGPVVDDDEIPAGSTSYAVEDLEPGTTYYFRVRAIANTKSAWSDVIEVTTSGEKPIPVPDLTVMAPETLADTSLAAFWVCTGAAQFRLQVATDEAFTSLVFDETMTEIAKTVTGLTPETTYYVRVCALDGERVGDWSNVESITTAASGGDVPVQADIEAVTIDGTARTMKFAVPADAMVMTTTNLVTGPWVAYEGDVDGEGNVVIPLTGTAAFFRLGEPPAGD